LKAFAGKERIYFMLFSPAKLLKQLFPLMIQSHLQTQWKPMNRMPDRQAHMTEHQALTIVVFPEKSVMPTITMGRIAHDGMGYVRHMAS
jgi:hypothetical protein